MWGVSHRWGGGLSFFYLVGGGGGGGVSPILGDHSFFYFGSGCSVWAFFTEVLTFADIGRRSGPMLTFADSVVGVGAQKLPKKC